LGPGGYRSDRRYLVFQCLEHALGLGKAQIRLVELCHNQRSYVESADWVEVGEALPAERIAATNALWNPVAQSMDRAS
jgi:hypothetical protein